VFFGLLQKTLTNNSEWQFEKRTIPKRQYSYSFWFWKLWVY